MTLTRFDKDTQVKDLAGGLNDNSDIIEDHFDAINPHPQGRLVVDVSGDQDVILTAEEARNAQLVFEGTLTGDISVIMPNNNMIYHVQNLTSGAYTLTLKTGAGTGVPIQQADLPDYPRIKRVMVDGTNVVWADGAQVVEDNLHEETPDAGYYIRYANGVMIAFGIHVFEGVNVTPLGTTPFFNTPNLSISLPEFTSPPSSHIKIAGHPGTSDGTLNSWVAGASVADTATTIYFRIFASIAKTNATYPVSYIAIGRWK